MKKKEHVSILILTHNRAALLERCLMSLANQLGRDDEIIVVDNGSVGPTADVVARHKQQLPIIYCFSRLTGYPALYNFAIQKSTKPIVVFLDDDCHVDKKFVESIRRAHARHSNTLVQGMTYSLPVGNIYAEIMGAHYQNWLRINRLKDGRMRTFDNKNASVPRLVLDRFGMFSEWLAIGSEDVELGIRLRHSGVSIVLDTSIVAYHQERSTAKDFFLQHLRIARSESILDGYLPLEDKIHAINLPKLFLHLRSALQLEIVYLSQGRLKDAFLLPLLYISLFIIRIWGYATVRHKKRSA